MYVLGANYIYMYVAWYSAQCIDMIPDWATIL